MLVLTPKTLGACYLVADAALPQNLSLSLLEPFADYVIPVLKVGRVVIITRGRFAGKKAVIILSQDNGTKSHPYPHGKLQNPPAKQPVRG